MGELSVFEVDFGGRNRRGVSLRRRRLPAQKIVKSINLLEGNIGNCKSDMVAAHELVEIAVLDQVVFDVLECYYVLFNTINFILRVLDNYLVIPILFLSRFFELI